MVLIWIEARIASVESFTTENFLRKRKVKDAGTKVHIYTQSKVVEILSNCLKLPRKIRVIFLPKQKIYCLLLPML